MRKKAQAEHLSWRDSHGKNNLQPSDGTVDKPKRKNLKGSKQKLRLRSEKEPETFFDLGLSIDSTNSKKSVKTGIFIIVAPQYISFQDVLPSTTNVSINYFILKLFTDC